MLLAGCGGGVGEDPGVEGARETVRELMGRLADGDRNACELMTGDAQRALVAAYPTSSCRDSVESLAGSISEEERRALKSVTVPAVAVTGTTARVADTQLGPTEGRLGSGWDGYTALGYLDGRWLVTGLG